jgi:hypothetical protein
MKGTLAKVCESARELAKADIASIDAHVSQLFEASASPKRRKVHEQNIQATMF